MKIGLFFGSDEGNTESVAERIRVVLSEYFEVDIYDVADVTQLDFIDYQYLVLGIPTWDFGQIQSDWEEFWPELDNIDFQGKTVALFGLGDQFGYADYFLDAMGMLHDVIAKQAKMIGYWSAENYEFDTSKAYLPKSNQFVGLAIDEDQQEALTDQRIAQWCQQIREEFAMS